MFISNYCIPYGPCSTPGYRNFLSLHLLIFEAHLLPVTACVPVYRACALAVACSYLFEILIKTFSRNFVVVELFASNCFTRFFFPLNLNLFHIRICYCALSSCTNTLIKLCPALAQDVYNFYLLASKHANRYDESKTTMSTTDLCTPTWFVLSCSEVVGAIRYKFAIRTKWRGVLRFPFKINRINTINCSLRKFAVVTIFAASLQRRLSIVLSVNRILVTQSCNYYWSPMYYRDDVTAGN